MSLNRACSVWAFLAVVICSNTAIGAGVVDESLSVNYGRLGVATDIYSASPEYAVPLDAEAQAAALPDLKGMLVVDQYAEMLGVSSDDLEINKYKWNPEGDLHVSFKQMYDGFPVHLTSVSVHFFKDGMLQGISANTVPLSILEQLDLGVLVEEKELQTLINADSEAMKESYEVQKAEQLVYVPALNPESDADIYENYLVWNVIAKDSKGLPWSIFVDAKTGAVLKYISRSAGVGAHNQKVCDSQTADNCNSSPAYKGVWLDGTWYASGSGCNGDTHCEAAKDNLADVFEYYQNNLGRNNFSGDLDDVVLLMYDDYNENVCYLEYTGTYWRHNLYIKSAAILSYTESIETVAHEFTHGISWYELGWEETVILMVGAMIESNADVMGILIGNQGDWDFADDYYYYPDFTVPLRILDNPNFDGSWDPLRSDMATYCNSETNKAHPEKWEMYTPMPDINNGTAETHFNSTIFSKVFQLYVDGGTYNGMVLVGVGETIAANVWHKTLTEAYWQTSQDAQQWAYRAVLACQNEYGSTSIYCTRLFRAAAAVGIAPLPRTISANAAATPHPVSFDDKLWIFWRDSDTNEIKYKTTSSSIGSLTTPTWSSITSTGKYSTTSPTPIVYNGRLMLFWTRNTDLRIRYMYNDGSWSSEYSPAGATSASSKKIAAAIRSLSGDRLYIVYRDNSTTAIKYRAMNWPLGDSHSTLLWGTESALSNAYTSYAPAVTAYDDDLLVLYKNSADGDVRRTFISGSVSPENVQEMYSEDDLTVNGDLVGWAHNDRQYFFGRKAYVIGTNSNMGFVSTAVGDDISENWYAYVDLGSTTASTNAPGVTTHQGYMVITTSNSAGNINYMFMR